MNPRFTSLALVAAFIATRLLYLLLLDPARVLEPAGEEELARGTLGRDLIGGLQYPFMAYRADDYSGGSLVVGVLAAVAFLAFGPTLLALKLVPVVFFAGALLLWRRILIEAGERTAAWYFTALFCLSPPFFTAYSVTAMGYHAESIAFSALAIWLLFRLRASGTRDRALAFALGVTAGFGLWFAYVFGVTLLALAVFRWWRGSARPDRRVLVPATVGFVVGLAPWGAVNLASGFAGLAAARDLLAEHATADRLWQWLTDVRRIAPVTILQTLGSEDPSALYRRSTSAAYAVLLAAPFAALVFRRRRMPVTPPVRTDVGAVAILYTVLFLLAVQVTGFRTPRYFVPLYPFLFVLTALAAARAEQLRPGDERRIRRWFVIAWATTAVVTHVPLISWTNPGFVLRAQGYSWATLPRGGVEPEHRFVAPAAPSSDDAADRARLVARTLAGRAAAAASEQEFREVARRVPAGLEPYFAYAAGERVAETGADLVDLEDARVRLGARSEWLGRTYPCAVAGVSAAWARSAPPDDPTPVDRVRRARQGQTTDGVHWRALGHWSGRFWHTRDGGWHGLAGHLSAIDADLTEPMRTAFLEGVGQSLFGQPREPRTLLPSGVPARWKAPLLAGWGMALARFEIAEPFPWKGERSPFWPAWTTGLSGEDLGQVHEGRAALARELDLPGHRAPPGAPRTRAPCAEP